MTDSDLRQFLAEHPGVTEHGWSHHPQPQPDPDLLDRLTEINLCLEWLERVRYNKTPNQGSYTLKHRVEDWAGHYIPNGAFIAAALFAGVPAKLDSPNPRFALRQSDIDALTRRGR